MAKPVRPDKKKKIMADWLVTHNYSETGKKFGVTHNTVRNIIKEMEEHDPEFSNTLQQKADETNQSVLEYLESMADLKKQAMHNLLTGIVQMSEKPTMFDNPKDYATAYGILYDKEIKKLELQIQNAGSARTIETDKLSEALESIGISMEKEKSNEPIQDLADS